MSPMLSIVLDGDGAGADIPVGMLRVADDTGRMRFVLLRGGMASGKHSVSLLIPMPDGATVFAETSLELFFAAADAFRGRLQYEEAQRVRSN